MMISRPLLSQVVPHLLFPSPLQLASHSKGESCPWAPSGSDQPRSDRSGGKKKRELETLYAPEKVKKLTDALKSKGMWYWDPDFVGDEEDPGTQLYEMIFLYYDSMLLPTITHTYIILMLKYMYRLLFFYSCSCPQLSAILGLGDLLLRPWRQQDPTRWCHSWRGDPARWNQTWLWDTWCPHHRWSFVCWGTSSLGRWAGWRHKAHLAIYCWWRCFEDQAPKKRDYADWRSCSQDCPWVGASFMYVLDVKGKLHFSMWRIKTRIIKCAQTYSLSFCLPWILGVAQVGCWSYAKGFGWICRVPEACYLS